MGERLTRTTAADLIVRGDGRTVAGIAVPYDREADIGSYVEVFRRGAFARTIRERMRKVKFLASHDRATFPLGRATLLREDTAGLYGEFRVSQTERGDEALALIRDGALDALSVGFEEVDGGQRMTRRSGGGLLIERTEVKLLEVSAVAFPAYAGAAILAVRDLPALPVTEARSRLAAILEAYPP